MASSLSSSLHNMFENPLQGSFSSWAQLLPNPSPESPPRPRLDKSSSWNGNVVQNPDADADAIDILDMNRKSVGNDGRKKKVVYTRSYSDSRSRSEGGLFPPPITSIGRGGKPRVYFKSFRKDGRFVLREIKIPTQRILQATREDGRLRMRVVEPVEDLDDRREGGDPEKEDDVGSCDDV